MGCDMGGCDMGTCHFCHIRYCVFASDMGTSDMRGRLTWGRGTSLCHVSSLAMSRLHFGQKKRALPQLIEKSLIETRPLLTNNYASFINVIISLTLQSRILHKSFKVTVVIGLLCFNRSRSPLLMLYLVINLYVDIPFCFSVL